MKLLRPYALIYKSGGLQMGSEAQPAGYNIILPLTIEFHENIPEELVNDPPEAERRLENFIGLVIASFDDTKPGLRELSKIAEQGYTKILTLVDEGPFREEDSKTKTLDDYQRHYLDIQLGWQAP